MRPRRVYPLVLLGLGAFGILFGQRGSIRDFIDEEDNPAAIPADAADKAEYTFARLRYPPKRNGYFGRGGGAWSTDWPKADRQFVQGVRRLTRVSTRSIEKVVEIEAGDFMDFPWMYATEVGRWDFNEKQAAKMREYLLKGGFLMTDDFHGQFEWSVFYEGLQKIFPDRPVVDIENKDQIFHVLYDLDERFQVPGIQMFFTGSISENGGVEDKWRAVLDDKGRIMVAICHNMDLGDAWEWADHPRYPEKYTSLAYRVGVNYIIYSMTH